MRRIAIALVHHPVLDGQGAIVTSAVTNLDVHDIARSARTYGVTDYFVVHPITAQRELVERIQEHWDKGSSGKRIPARKAALSLVRTVASLEDVYAALGGRASIETWTTAAKASSTTMSMDEARARIAAEGPPIVLIFGTAWGLAPAVHAAANSQLAPIQSKHADYNHLSVRAACAIYLDRLLGG